VRDRVIRIRASEAELSTMKSLAVSRGLSLSDLLRRMTLGLRMPVRRFNHADAAVLIRMLGELGRIGGNLNQLTRRANAGKFVGHDAELSATLAEIDALRCLIREIIA
jgi:hypothetical protein